VGPLFFDRPVNERREAATGPSSRQEARLWLPSSSGNPPRIRSSLHLQDTLRRKLPTSPGRILRGPVLCFETFATEDEAITRANATIFGLAASIFTKVVDRA
jgi:hypothetical protein